MLWLDKIFGWFGFGSPDDLGSGGVTGWQDDARTVNPASGLPMVGGLDVAGNPYGTNMQDSCPSRPTGTARHPTQAAGVPISAAAGMTDMADLPSGHVALLYDQHND